MHAGLLVTVQSFIIASTFSFISIEYEGKKIDNLKEYDNTNSYCNLCDVLVYRGLGLYESNYADSSALRIFKLPYGLIGYVEKEKFWIVDSNQKELFRNNSLIRNGSNSCPISEFETIVSKGSYFTIQQWVCSGWNIVREYATFRILKNGNEIVLHKFSVESTDRSNPDAVIPPATLTKKDFGYISINDVDLDDLYPLFR